MHRLLGITVVAGALCGGAGAAGAQDGDGPSVAVQTTLGELLTAAAKEMGVVLAYADDVGGRRVALSSAPAAVTARALLEQGLRLHGLRLDVDGAAKTGRVVHIGRNPTVVAIALRSGERAQDQEPDQLVSRVYRLSHADPGTVAGVLRSYLRNTNHEWVNATRGPNGAVLVTVNAERLDTFETVIAELDQPATRGEVVEVVTVEHGRTAELAAILSRMCSSETEGLRAEAGPDGATIALVGSAWRMSQAKALLAGLDRPRKD